MGKLSQQQCQTNDINAEKISDDEIARLLPQLPDWGLVSEDATQKLRKVYKFKNFVEAMAFANRLSELAELEFHHPDILISWGSATVTWWSHEINGLHKNDFILAARTDILI